MGLRGALGEVRGARARHQADGVRGAGGPGLAGTGGTAGGTGEYFFTWRIFGQGPGGIQPRQVAIWVLRPGPPAVRPIYAEAGGSTDGCAAWAGTARRGRLSRSFGRCGWFESAGAGALHRPMPDPSTAAGPRARVLMLGGKNRREVDSDGSSTVLPPKRFMPGGETAVERTGRPADALTS